jgi:hypothetical protein
MKYKTLFFAIILSTPLFIASYAAAQTPPASGAATQAAPMLTPEQRIERRLAHARKKLGLSDAQVAQLRTILQQNEGKIMADRQAMRTSPQGDARKDARKHMAADVKSMAEQMKGVLSADQFKKWKEMKIDQIQRRQKRLERRENALKK